jgi:hypothetical protein
MSASPLRRLAGAVVLALLAAPAAAQGVPEPLRGAWFAGDCADPQAMLAVTARAAARIDAEEPAQLFRFRELRELAGWTLGVAGGEEAPRLLLRAGPDGLETAEPDPKLRDDRLPGEPSPSVWRRCPTPPPALAALHGEGVAFLATLEHLEAACGTGTPGACAAAIVAQADVSGDGALAPAELARLARGAAWLAAVQEGGTQEVIAAAVGAGAVGGILAARLLVESLDYDGDGRISALELGQDRTAFAGATGTAEGRPLRVEGLAEGAGMLRGLVEALMSLR